MTLQHSDPVSALVDVSARALDALGAPIEVQACADDGGSTNEVAETDDRSAHYARFVLDTRERLLRVLVAHHGPDVGAEALADAYAYAWEHWDRVSQCANAVGYVFRVGDRVGVRRAMKLRRESPTRAADPEAQPSTPTASDNQFDSVGAGLGLESLLQILPARQRAAVLLVHGYGWSYRDAAETMDIPLTTLTNEVNRGTQKLREHMKKTNSMDSYS
jgi:DNA-directed RNA polymerase specialized sigma24 family protein